MKDLAVRKKIRLKDYDYSQAGHYFITMCVKDRHELLGKVVGATVLGRPCPAPYVELTDIGRVVDAAIKYNDRDNISIRQFVVMPNHIHMIIAIMALDTGDRGRSPLQMILRNMKAYVTKQIGFSMWQKSYHDHIIRNEKEYYQIWQYIDENPTRWSEDCYNPNNAGSNPTEVKR